MTTTGYLREFGLSWRSMINPEINTKKKFFRIFFDQLLKGIESLPQTLIF